MNDKVVYSSHEGKNSTIIKDIEKLYFEPGDSILDMTYGKGNFWNSVDINKYRFFKIDIHSSEHYGDLRDTPSLDSSHDVVVLDPPYAKRNDGCRDKLNKSYGLSDINTIYDIQELYYKGMLEARRILKRRGLLILKCQDVRYGGKDYWMYIDIFNHATQLGFKAVDLFVLNNSIHVKTYNQRCSRKNHSYMWVLQSLTGGRV